MAIEIMAEGTAGLRPEAAGAPALQRTESLPAGNRIKPPQEEVLKNAALSEDQRPLAAEAFLREGGLLEGSLTAGQRQGIVDIHNIGNDQHGKGGGEPGVYGYTFSQVREKAIGLEALGFNQAQRRVLMEWGYVGRLPAGEFAGFDKTPYAGTALEGVVDEILDIGSVNGADEVFLGTTAQRIQNLVDSGRVPYATAKDLLKFVNEQRLRAVEGLTSTDPLLSTQDIRRIEQEIARGGGSEFARTRALFEHYSSIDINTLSPALQAELTNRRNATRAEILGFIDAADRLRILNDARKRALEFYKDVKATKRHEKWGRDKQQVIDSGRNAYGEFFWDNSPELKQLEGRYRGIARYIWDGIVAEADKEVNSESAPALNPVAEREFQEIKRQRAEARKGERKYATHEYYGSRNWELTAENAEELVPAVLDWTRDQLAEISDSDLGSINKQIEQIRDTGVRILETCRVRLESEEGQDIAETNPYFLRAKALIEAVTDVLGNEKVLYKGGKEIGPQYKERFASNFIGHHDAVYLENKYAAYIMHKLKRHRNGTYFLGQPLDTEKISEGAMADHRSMIEEEIKEDALAHDLFISEEVFRTREQQNLSYSFDDPLEELLLDSGNTIRNQVAAGGDPAALVRHDLRVGVFRKIKDRLDQRDKLNGLTPAERRQRVRIRILQKMNEKTKLSYLANLSKDTAQKMAEARLANNVGMFDKLMWDWVKQYNEYRIKMRLPRWSPTGWDRVRIRIDRQTKLIDRSLSEAEFEAMYEPVAAPDYNDPQTRYSLDEVRFGFQIGRSYAIFNMQDALLGGMRTRLVDQKTGQYNGRLPDDEASRLLGLIDQNGNVLHSDWKVFRIFDIVQARLEAAIKEEAAEIARVRASGDRQALRETLVNAQFLATHVLKELGVVEGKLPVWSYNFLDESTLNVFMNALGAFGVESAPGIPLSHNNKKAFYEIAERGRRALKSEYARVAREHMEGTYPVFERDANGQITARHARSLWRAENDWGDLGEINERYRMINKGGLAEDREPVDTQFGISTSGGVAVTELIPQFGDIGFYPLLVWLGVTDLRELHGYIHRRDEAEFHDHKFFDVLDPVQHAKALAAAYPAIKSLTGGEIVVDGQKKRSPGVLKEPFHGGFKSADWLHEQHQLAQKYGMDATDKYLAMMQKYRSGDKSYSEFLDSWSGVIKTVRNGSVEGMKVKGAQLEEFRQLTYLDLDRLDKRTADAFYMTMYGVLDYFQDYLKAVKEVESNRRGRAPRNWEDDNHLRWYAFRRAMRDAMQNRREKGFIIRLGYSPEVASEIALRMMEIALQDADYLILRSYEVQRRVGDGVEILSKALFDKEKENGFVIPDEKDWSKERPEVQKALKTIRRRGLLEFMTEEGYQLTYSKGIRKILGKKVPPYVQEKWIKEDKTGQLVASSKT